MKTLYKNTVKALLALSIVLAMSTLTHASTTHIPSDLTSTSEFSEETLSVEEWMINLDDWNKFDLQNDLVASFESQVSVEEWMLDANDTNWSLIQKVENEDEVEIESWMSDLTKW